MQRFVNLSFSRCAIARKPEKAGRIVVPKLRKLNLSPDQSFFLLPVSKTPLWTKIPIRIGIVYHQIKKISNTVIVWNFLSFFNDFYQSGLKITIFFYSVKKTLYKWKTARIIRPLISDPKSIQK